ncbi:MAG: DUF6056 family protein [Ruthenibacterium sp.]
MKKQLTLKDRVNRTWVPFTLLFIVFLLLHMQFTLGTGDDPMYAMMLKSYDLKSFSIWHYYTWSARTLVEAVLCLVEALPSAVWRLVNPAVLTLIAFCMARLLNIEKNAPACWILCGLFLTLRWQNLASAGWICTTLVFVWPLAAALVAVQPYVMLQRGKKPKNWVCILTLPLLLYATNMEQLLVVTLFCLLAYLVWRIATKQKIHWLVFAQLVICAANLLYAATCPGNASRIAGETASWYQNFKMRNLLQGIELGISNGLAASVYHADALFAVFCLLLCCGVFMRYRNWFYRALGAFPVSVVFLLGILEKPLGKIIPKLSFFANALTQNGTITVQNCMELKRYLPFLLLCAVFCACLLDLYLALGHSGAAVAGITVFCAGFASRAMLGFSPTVWLSGTRTAFFFACSMVFAGVLVWKTLPKDSRKIKILFVCLLGICAICACFSLIGA